MLAIAIVATLVAWFGDANQPPDLLVQHACKADVDKFCPAMHDPIKILECLQDHERDLAANCTSGLHRCPMYNCINDVKKFCPDSIGTKQTLTCLWKHRSELSDQCINQPGPVLKLGFLPESHVCTEDELKFCANEGSFLSTMQCLRQPNLESSLSPECFRSVGTCRLFACASEAEKSCPEITTFEDLKGCIMQHSLQCLPEANAGPVANDTPFPFMFCEVEAQLFCRNVPKANLYDCLDANHDSVSKQCKKSLKSSLENKCEDERISFCSDQTDQQLKDCLIQVKSVSKKCQRALVTLSDVRTADIGGNRLDSGMDPDDSDKLEVLNIVLTSLACISFIVLLVGLGYVVRKSRSASLSFDSLPSATTSTEYVRI